MAQEAGDSRSVAESLPDAPLDAAPAKQSVKSFKCDLPSKSYKGASLMPGCRKKYAKLKVKFDAATRESETLIREELRIEDLSKRIREQNE